MISGFREKFGRGRGSAILPYPTQLCSVLYGGSHAVKTPVWNPGLINICS